MHERKFRLTDQQFRIALPLAVAQMAVFSSDWDGNVTRSCELKYFIVQKITNIIMKYVAIVQKTAH